jgi:hypothetical protein
VTLPFDVRHRDTGGEMRFARLDKLSHLLRSSVGRPIVRLLFWLLIRGVARERVGPFDVIDVTGNPEFGPHKAKFAEASALIRKYDPARYDNLLRDLSLIVVADHQGRLEAQYHRFARAILVRATALQALDVHSVAALLVHEGFHGRLDRMGILQTRGRMQRIERLCLLNEAKFLARVPGAELLTKVKREALLEM